MKIFKSRKNLIKTILILVLIIIIFGSIAYISWPYVSSQEKVRQIIQSFGIYAPIAFIFLHILQVLISPFPGQFIGILAGYLFGFWFGLFLVLIGLTLGGLAAFLLVRKYGRPFAEKVIKKDVLAKFDRAFEKGGVFAIFLMFLFPFFPDDMLCFACGLTKMKVRTFLFIVIFGRMPGFVILTLAGAGIGSYDFRIILMTIVVAALLFGILIFVDLKFVKKYRKKLGLE